MSDTFNGQDDGALDLDALAVQERFLEEWRAGKRPRLSAYLRRYPQHAAALAALVAALPPDTLAGTAQEPLAESFPERLWTGAGVARALAEIFGPEPAGHEAPRVAEERAPYQTPADDAPRDE
ncbi:MAG TPA: hypothetical protein VF725_11115 [Ktedonobacterales bacterium]